MKKQTQATVAGPSGAAKPAPASSTPSVPPASKPLPAQPLKYHFTQEEAEAQIEGVLPSTMLAELRDSVWKVRLAALEALQSWLEGEGQDVNSELIVRTLSKSPGWKESNFQVYGKMAGVFSYLSQSSSSWTRACSALTIGALSDKLGDIKLKKPAGDTLVAYAEKYSLQFVLSQGGCACTSGIRRTKPTAIPASI